MGTSVIRSYRPVPWAVLPGSIVRGLVVSLLYVPLAFIVIAYLDDALAAVPIAGAIQGRAGFFAMVAVAFLFPLVASCLLTLLAYGRRRYELGADGITERRGLLLTSERLIPYDDIEEVIFTQSKVQSLYGAATIRLADVDENREIEQRMKLSFIESPGAVYTNLLRNVADPTESTERETLDVGEVPSRSEDLSRLSGDSLAAGTGFQYLMPSAVLHPDPWSAAKYGALLAGGYSLIGAAVLYVIKPVLTWLLEIPSETHFKAFIAAGAVAYAFLLSGWFYWKYDRRQYELYNDHVRFIDGGERTSVALSNVAGLEQRDGTIRGNDVGHVALVEDDGNDLLKFEFVGDLEGVYESLNEWMNSAS
jgi:membrane protein YdbS with pleckstrin-like domain